MDWSGYMGLTARAMALLGLCMALTSPSALTQLTQPKSGCTFLDGNENVFNIEVLRGQHSHPCPTLQDADDEMKVMSNQLAETSYEVMELQARVIGLMDTQLSLSLEMERLQDELRATQYAMQVDETVSSDCPHGYKEKNTTFNSCYMFVPRELTWYDGETFCLSTRGHLVAIETKEEQNFLVNKIIRSTIYNGKNYWTGGNDIGSENSWRWPRTNEPFSYTNWMTVYNPDKGRVQMPDNGAGNEHCVLLFHTQNYGWDDASCDLQNYLICEYKVKG